MHAADVEKKEQKPIRMGVHLDILIQRKIQVQNIWHPKQHVSHLPCIIIVVVRAVNVEMRYLHTEVLWDILIQNRYLLRILQARKPVRHQQPITINVAGVACRKIKHFHTERHCRINSPKKL